MKRKVGIYDKLGALNYFIPDSLPPKDPPLNFSKTLIEQYGKAMLSLGKLNEMTQRIPESKRFIKAYVIKEALLSSAIEGINTTLTEAFTQSITKDTISKETKLVLNYTKAVYSAIDMLTKKNLPIANRLILSAHNDLMTLGKSNYASPGQYRKQTVRVGEFIPPQAQHVPKLMSDLEKYINNDDTLPPLVKAGLAHVQFETIHPFLDGNGRIGRLLIILMLIDCGLLDSPILYSSYYFKKHHAEYYQRLDNVRLNGDFEGWLHYYLKGIEASSIDAYKRAKEIEKLEKQIRNTFTHDESFSGLQTTALDALPILFQYPIIGIQAFSEKISKSYNTTLKLFNSLIEKKILREATEQKRNKLYKFEPYLTLLEKDY